MTNDPIYDRIRLELVRISSEMDRRADQLRRAYPSGPAGQAVFADPVHFPVHALLNVLDLPSRVEDRYDRDGYDKAEGYNEALADVREAIARALGVEQ
jgi:hypothetical protein